MDNTLFSTAMMKLDAVIKNVTPDTLANPTPCIGWDVHTLTNHLINELAWVAPLLEGKTIGEVGDELDGDLIGEDAAASWNKYCQAASTAMLTTAPDAVTHLSYADKTAQAYVDEVSADILIHGWDLAKSVGVPYEIDEKTAEAIKKATEAIMPMAREGGYIGKELPVANDAAPLEKLLAYFGRSNNWSA